MPRFTYKRRQAPSRYQRRKTKGYKTQRDNPLSLAVIQRALAATGSLPATKYNEAYVYHQLVEASGALFNVGNVSQGTTDSTRVGDTIHIKGLTVRIHAYSDATASEPSCMRAVLFQMRDSNSPAPSMANLFSNTTYPWISPFNFDDTKSGRLRVIRDWTFSVQATTTGGNATHDIVEFIPAKLFPQDTIQFLQGGPTANNQVYLILVSDKITGPGLPNPPYMDVLTRLRFTD